MKPILFNTEMVRAILEGRKTVTRRVVKPQPAGDGSAPEPLKTRPGYWNSWGDDNVYRQPYQPGDILWVRETWSPVNVRPKRYIYKADVARRIGEGVGLPLCWHPSIHMPKEAARIFLRVTGVRVERLQEITEDGAKAEGAEKSYPYTDPETGKTVFVLDEKGTYCSGFSQVWDRTIKQKDRLSCCWESTPWVWVIDFERISKEEAQTS